MLKSILITVNLIFIVFTFVHLTEKLPIPMEIVEKVNHQEKAIKEALIYLNAPTKDIPELTDAILTASTKINISPLLIVALIDTESNFKIDAISNKNYKGLMQTPTATMQFIDADILHGARILEEKLKYAKGDLVKALTYYKAGQNAKPAAMKQGKEQAEQVYNLYMKLKQKSI